MERRTTAKYRNCFYRQHSLLPLSLAPSTSPSLHYIYPCYSLLSSTYPAPGKNNNLHCESPLLPPPPPLLLHLLLRFYYFSLLLCSFCCCCCCCCATFYLHAARFYVVIFQPRLPSHAPTPSLCSLLADWRCNFSRRFSHKHADEIDTHRWRGHRQAQDMHMDTVWGERGREAEQGRE